MNIVNEERQIEAYFPPNNRGSLPSLPGEGIREYDTFNDYILGNNLEQAYKVFKKCPRALLLYHINRGEDAVQSVFEQTRKQVGFFAATRMSLTLDALLIKEKKKWDQLKETIKVIDEKAESEKRERHKVLDIVFNV